MERGQLLLDEFINRLLAGEPLAWAGVVGIVLAVLLIRKIIQGVAKRYGWFFKVLFVLVLILLGYALYTRPENVSEAFYRAVAWLEAILP